MQSASSNQALGSAAKELVRALKGQWRPEGAMCRCPAHDDRSPSLSVRVGERSLLFKCFAGCRTDDVLRAIRCLKVSVPAVHDSRLDRSLSDCSDKTMINLATSIWNAARPITGTPAEAYLAARGIDNISAVLRFHLRTPIGRGRAVRFRPAMIAAVTECGRLVAIQRIFLEPDGHRLAVDLPKPKLALGRPLGGSVALQPADHRLGLAEGVKSALSASILLGIPVWATPGNERLSRLWLPPDLKRLILEIEGDIWTIPAIRTKMEVPHEVVLCERSSAIVADMSTIGGPYLFGGKKPLSNLAMTMLLRRLGVDDCTVHGFRSGFKDWALNETEFPDELSEEALAHLVGSSVRRAYRRGVALERRRSLTEAWERFSFALRRRPCR